MKSLELISRVKSGDKSVLKKEKWLMYLYLTNEKRVNLERIESISEISENSVLNYVEKTLQILDSIDCNGNIKGFVEEVLKWSEVSKCGLPNIRKQWKSNGYNLFVHNVGSSQIYSKEIANVSERKKIILTLIETHGLIGQFLRGEVNFSENIPLKTLINDCVISQSELSEILLVLNECIIRGVLEHLWEKVEKDIQLMIENVVNGNFDKEYSTMERISKLRAGSISNGEDLELETQKCLSKNILDAFNYIFSTAYLWYVESALGQFSFEEFVKIFMIVYKLSEHLNIKHISFEKIMLDLYYDYNGRKAVNLYKKRIIEKYLLNMSIDDILNNNIPKNEHVRYCVDDMSSSKDTLSFFFKFSRAGQKLIEFCEEAEKSSSIYERGVILLYDLFGFRKDAYDRFNNEQSYLEKMNGSIDYKSIILDYIVGKDIVDVGPGGGALMDMISSKMPNKNIVGIDISENVISDLKMRKKRENREWDVLKGDVMNLKEYVEKESLDTIIFSSIIHELFSYIVYEGMNFNHNTIKVVLKNSFDCLRKGGRIIIRDGIMTEPNEQKRIIEFKDHDGLKFLERYSKDFKGREIKYNLIKDNFVEMNVNDCMEFLYTYTWGEDSYVHEVNEQFGYFTPSEYRNFVMDVLGSDAKIVEFKHFLQDGYEEYLLKKINLFDENYNKVKLPESTVLLVIEKV